MAGEVQEKFLGPGGKSREMLSLNVTGGDGGEKRLFRVSVQSGLWGGRKGTALRV